MLDSNKVQTIRNEIIVLKLNGGSYSQIQQLQKELDLVLKEIDNYENKDFILTLTSYLDGLLKIYDSQKKEVLYDYVENNSKQLKFIMLEESLTKLESSKIADEINSIVNQINKNKK